MTKTSKVMGQVKRKLTKALELYSSACGHECLLARANEVEQQLLDYIQSQLLERDEIVWKYEGVSK